jgi:hypothetical protein
MAESVHAHTPSKQPNLTRKVYAGAWSGPQLVTLPGGSGQGRIWVPGEETVCGVATDERVVG